MFRYRNEKIYLLFDYPRTTMPLKIPFSCNREQIKMIKFIVSTVMPLAQGYRLLLMCYHKKNEEKISLKHIKFKQQTELVLPRSFNSKNLIPNAYLQ